MIDGEAVGEASEPAATSTPTAHGHFQSRAGGHLVEDLAYGPGRWVRCTCDALLRGFDDDDAMAAAFTAHRRVGVRDAPQEMARTKVDSSNSNQHYRLELVGRLPPAAVGPGPIVTIVERKWGIDHAPATPLPLRRLGGRLAGT